MGKHSKARNFGRAALVVGAAPLALLIANGTASAADLGTVNPLGIPVGTLTSHLDTSSTQTPDGQSNSVTASATRSTTVGGVTDSLANSACGTVAQRRTAAVDPAAGSADFGQSEHTAAGTDATHTVKAALPDGGTASATEHGALAGGSDAAETVHADRSGHVTATSKHEHTISGEHDITAAGSYGPASGTASAKQAVTGSLSQTRSVDFAPRSGVLTAAEIAAAHSVQSSRSASMTMGAMTFTSSDQQATTESSTLANATAVTPQGQHSSVSSVSHTVSGSSTSTRGLAVAKALTVSATDSTSGSYAESATVGEHNGTVDPPRHTQSYRLKHSNNVHVQVGNQSHDRGVDVSLPPLVVTPHSS